MTNPQQPISPMLEKCARAIADGLGLAYSNGREPDLDESDFHDAARACLQALMEADDKTIEAMWLGAGHQLNDRPVWKQTVDVQMRHALECALQAVLGESK